MVEIREGDAMMDGPVHLDERRGVAALKAAERRRRRNHRLQEDQAAWERRQEEMERYLAADPATTWTDAAAKAAYLIQLFAATPEGEDPRRKALIKRTLDDLKRLCGDGSERGEDGP